MKGSSTKEGGTKKWGRREEQEGKTKRNEGISKRAGKHRHKDVEKDKNKETK